MRMNQRRRKKKTRMKTTRKKSQRRKLSSMIDDVDRGILSSVSQFTRYALCSSSLWVFGVGFKFHQIHTLKRRRETERGGFQNKVMVLIE